MATYSHVHGHALVTRTPCGQHFAVFWLALLAGWHYSCSKPGPNTTMCMTRRGFFSLLNTHRSNCSARQYTKDTRSDNDLCFECVHTMLIKHQGYMRTLSTEGFPRKNPVYDREILPGVFI